MNGCGADESFQFFLSCSLAGAVVLMVGVHALSILPELQQS